MRLIDADALKEKLLKERDAIPLTYTERYCFGVEFPSSFGQARRGGVKTALRCMEQTPTIDAVPVVRKPVVGYEGYYEVDQFGRVFSLDRSVVVADGNRSYTKNLKGKQMKQAMHGKGYKVVTLTKDGKMTNLYVHRIVAEAFLPNPDNLPMVNHKDEDKANNFLENLEWCTAAYNRTYGNAIEKQAKTLRGRESGKRTPVIQKYADGKFANRYDSISEAALSVNGAVGAISAVCKGKRKLAYGFRWEYDFCSYGERKDGDGK